MCALPFFVIILFDRYNHHFCTHDPEFFTLNGLGVYVGPHFVRSLVVYFEISLRNFVSDEEKSIFDVLALLSSTHSAIIGKQNC